MIGVTRWEAPALSSPFSHLSPAIYQITAWFLKAAKKDYKYMWKERWF